MILAVAQVTVPLLALWLLHGRTRYAAAAALALALTLAVLFSKMALMAALSAGSRAAYLDTYYVVTVFPSVTTLALCAALVPAAALAAATPHGLPRMVEMLAALLIAGAGATWLSALYTHRRLTVGEAAAGDALNVVATVGIGVATGAALAIAALGLRGAWCLLRDHLRP